MNNLELTDFEQAEVTPIEEFALGEGRKELPVGKVPASELAAKEVFLSEEPSEQEFQRIKQGLLSGEDRREFYLEQQARREAAWDELFQDSVEMSQDQALSDDELTAFLSSAVREAEQSESKTIMEEMILHDDGERETSSEANSKDLLVDIIDDVYEQKRVEASMINAYQASKNPSLGSMAVDIAEYLVPFANWKSADDLAEFMNADDSLLEGNNRQDIYDAVKNIPFEKRSEFLGMVINYLETHGNVVLPDGNDLANMDFLNKMYNGEEYTTAERWVDNVFSVVDVAGIFALAAGGIKSLRGTIKASTAASNVSPTSPLGLAEASNPKEAKKIIETIEGNEEKEVAEALAGSTKTEVTAHNRLPSPTDVDGRVPVKAPAISLEPSEIETMRSTFPVNALSETERRSIDDRVIARLTDVTGMKVQPNTMAIELDESGRSVFTVMYKPDNAGLKSYDEAMDNIMYSLRNTSVSPDEVVIYRQTPRGWEATTREAELQRQAVREKARAQKKAIPVDAKETTYSVGVRHTYALNTEDLKDLGAAARQKLLGGFPINFLSRTPLFDGRSGEGALTQLMVDPDSLLNPLVVGSASSAVDRAFALRRAYATEFENFAQGYASLGKERQSAMRSVIEQANREGKSIEDIGIASFSKEEQQLLRDWKRGNDILWHATNADFVKTLKREGWQVFTDDVNDTKLVGKPIPRNKVKASNKYYDHVADEIRPMFGSKEELDEFYESGGSFVRLREPIKVGGKWVSVVKTPNQASTAYLRQIRNEEAMLTYREGYYPVAYDANYYVQVSFKKDGKTITKTVGSARTKAAAQRHINKFRAEHAGENISIDLVEDPRLQTGNYQDELGAMSFDTFTSSGLSSQKIRGEQLKDIEADLFLMDADNLVDPLEAVATQISSLSQRASMRDWFDISKARFMENYGKKLGLTKYPGSVAQLTKTQDITMQELADARDLFRYINSMENGYINNIDDAFKLAVNSVADIFTSWGHKTGGKIPMFAEGALRETSKVGPSVSARAISFKLLLAANPLRQFVIQGHQSVQLAALFPKYFATGLGVDFANLNRAMLGMDAGPEAQEMYKQLQRTGLLEAVDSNAFTRQETLKLADASMAQKAQSAAMAPINLAQRVGFDTAERVVLVTSWLAHRNQALQIAKKQGRELTAQDYQSIAAKARSFTFNMNRSGDMPYGRNSLSAMLQFLATPHKAVMQPFFNTSMNRREKLQLLAFNTLMYGVPSGTFLHTYLRNNIEDPELNEVVTRGFEHYMLNEFATILSGEEQQIDWGDLAPTNITGMGEVITALATGDIGEIFSGSPAVSMITGSNPRLSDAFWTTMRAFHMAEDYEDPMLDTTFVDASLAFMNLFSGWSNAAKAKYAAETGMKMNTVGNIKDSDVTKWEATAQLFGFRTLTETATFDIQRRLQKEATGSSTYQKRAFAGDDVDQWYAELKRQLARSQTERDTAVNMAIVSEAQRVFADDKEFFRERIIRLIEKDAQAGDYKLIDQILKSTKWIDEDALRGIINTLPNGDVKSDLTGWLDYRGEQ